MQKTQHYYTWQTPTSNLGWPIGDDDYEEDGWWWGYEEDPFCGRSLNADKYPTCILMI